MRLEIWIVNCEVTFNCLKCRCFHFFVVVSVFFEFWSKNPRHRSIFYFIAFSEAACLLPYFQDGTIDGDNVKVGDVIFFEWVYVGMEFSFWAAVNFLALWAMGKKVYIIYIGFNRCYENTTREGSYHSECTDANTWSNPPPQCWREYQGLGLLRQLWLKCFLSIGNETLSNHWIFACCLPPSATLWHSLKYMHPSL